MWVLADGALGWAAAHPGESLSLGSFRFGANLLPATHEGLMALVVAKYSRALNALLEATKEVLEWLSWPCTDFQTLTPFPYLSQPSSTQYLCAIAYQAWAELPGPGAKLRLTSPRIERTEQVRPSRPATPVDHGVNVGSNLIGVEGIVVATASELG